MRLGKEIGIKGLYNIQFIVDSKEDVYVIEVNPRSSRTVPFISKATGTPLAHIATLVMLGHSLRDQGIDRLYPEEKKRWFVKTPAFSFAKLRGVDSYLSPEMKSTGEAIGYDKSLKRALYKSLQASGMTVANYGTVFVTIGDSDKQRALPLIRRFYNSDSTSRQRRAPLSFSAQTAYAPVCSTSSARAVPTSSTPCARVTSTTSSTRWS